MPPRKFTNKKKVNKKKRVQEPGRKLIRRQIIIGLLIVVIISLTVTAIYKVTRVESWQVKNVEVVGGQTIPHGEVEKITREAFSGTYLRLVPKSFRLTFPESAVESQVKAVDRVNNVEVKLKKDTAIVVYDEYIPVALWCETKEEKDCFFLDQSGYAFGEAPALEGSAFVRLVESGVKPEKYQTGFSGDFIRINQDFVEKMASELGLYVTHIEKLGDYDIEYTISGGGRIKTSQTMDLEKSFNNLRTVLLSEDFSHIEAGKFQYVDLRFGDKVFVNEELGQSVAASGTKEVSE